MQSHSSASFVVHNLNDAKRALEIAVRAGTDVTLLSAPSAASLLGPRIFNEMITAAMSEIQCDSIIIDAAIDCGDAAGPALRAIKEGCKHIVSNAPPDVLVKIRQIATTSNTRVTTGQISALDLGSSHLTDKQLLTWITKQENPIHA